MIEYLTSVMESYIFQVSVVVFRFFHTFPYLSSFCRLFSLENFNYKFYDFPSFSRICMNRDAYNTHQVQDIIGYIITLQQWNKITQLGHHHAVSYNNVVMILGCANHHSRHVGWRVRGIHPSIRPPTKLMSDNVHKITAIEKGTE